MTSYLRAQLQRKRSVLQARLRRQDLARQATAVAALLRAAGVRKLSRLPPSRNRDVMAPFATLPGRDERFYWPEIEGGTCLTWQSDTQREALFRRALRESFAPATRLVLIFHTAQYALVIASEDASTHASLVLKACRESLWIVPLHPDGRLAEVAFSDNEVCWGKTLRARGPA